MYWRLTVIIRLNNFKFIYMRISFLTLFTCFPRELEAAAVGRLEHCRIQDGGYGPRGLLVCFMADTNADGLCLYTHPVSQIVCKTPR